MGSINRANPSPTGAASVDWTVTFSESVAGVDDLDFALVGSGLTGSSIISVSGSGTTRNVTANTGTGDGTLGFNVVDDDPLPTSRATRWPEPASATATSRARCIAIDMTAPTATITNPVDAGTFANGTWITPLSGTAADVGTGVASVQYSVQQGSGNYWNGSSFSSGSEIKIAATGTASWSAAFALANFPADGTYTVRAYAIDGAANVSTAATSTFAVSALPKVTSATPNQLDNGVTQDSSSAAATPSPEPWSASRNSGSPSTRRRMTTRPASPSTDFTVAPGASGGPRTITVTNPDTGVGTGVGLFTIVGPATNLVTTSSPTTISSTNLFSLTFHFANLHRSNT